MNQDLERFPSGQREQTVNLPAYAFGGSNPPLSISKLRAGGVANNDDAGIAQLARAQAFQAWGRGFESRFPLSICCVNILFDLSYTERMIKL